VLAADGKADDDGGQENSGGGVPVEGEASFGNRFVEEVAEDGTQRPGEYERGQNSRVCDIGVQR
jgi:hypothetical protein